MLDTKFDILDPDITSALGTELGEVEVAKAMKPMTNAKAGGLYGLPVELLERGL